MTESAANKVFKRVVYHEFPSWTSIVIEATGGTKPYTGNFANAFANKSTIVIRTLAK